MSFVRKERVSTGFITEDVIINIEPVHRSHVTHVEVKTTVSVPHGTQGSQTKPESKSTTLAAPIQGEQEVITKVEPASAAQAADGQAKTNATATAPASVAATPMQPASMPAIYQAGPMQPASGPTMMTNPVQAKAEAVPVAEEVKTTGSMPGCGQGGPMQPASDSTTTTETV